MISSSQRPLPDNTRHSQQTNIHAPGGIRTQDLSRRAACGISRLRVKTEDKMYFRAALLMVLLRYRSEWAFSSLFRRWLCRLVNMARPLITLVVRSATLSEMYPFSLSARSLGCTYGEGGSRGTAAPGNSVKGALNDLWRGGNMGRKFSYFKLKNYRHNVSPIKTKRRLLYLNTQSVPRCKHFSSRL